MKFHRITILSLLILAACADNNSHNPVAKLKNQKDKNPDTVSAVKDETTGSAVEKEDNKYFSNFESIGNLPPAVSKFIPSGYLPLDTAIGDLDLDGTNDMLLVVKNKYEDTLTYSNDSPQFTRPLLILIAKPDGTYSLAKRNDSAIMAINSSGVARSDPFTGLKIKNGYFSVEHGESEGPQHWENITTFKYDKGQKEWFLFKDGLVTYGFNDSNDPDAEVLKETYNKVKTKRDFGIIPFEKYTQDKE